MAHLRHLDAIAVTDHDTLAGQSEAQFYGGKYGVEIVPGLELSGYDKKRGQKAHILCYYPKEPAALEPICAKIRENRERAALQMVQRVARRYPITLEMVERRAKDSVCIYKQHILHALADAGYTKSIFGEIYPKLFSAKDGLAYVEIDYPDVYEVLAAVRASRGVAVMAHPGESRQKGLLEELASKGLLDGVELYCPKNDAAEMERVRAIAEKYHLLLTGGTDFHGMYSSRQHCIGTFTASGPELERLKACAAKK